MPTLATRRWREHARRSRRPSPTTARSPVHRAAPAAAGLCPDATRLASLRRAICRTVWHEMETRPRQGLRARCGVGVGREPGTRQTGVSSHAARLPGSEPGLHRRALRSLHLDRPEPAPQKESRTLARQSVCTRPTVISSRRVLLSVYSTYQGNVGQGTPGPTSPSRPGRAAIEREVDDGARLDLRWAEAPGGSYFVLLAIVLVCAEPLAMPPAVSTALRRGTGRCHRMRASFASLG
jgi:hypothetical protein